MESADRERVRQFAVRKQQPRIMAVDHFYEHPEEVREMALRQVFGADPVYPGTRSPSVPVDPEVRDFLERSIGREAVSISSVFQVQTRADAADTFIHGDLSNWAAVVYLNADSDGAPGTTFYRHRETGRERLPVGPDLLFEAIERGVQPDDIVSPFTRDRFSESCWQPLLTIPVRFNRLLLYDARLFHRNAISWGEGLRDSRLVQAFFLFTESEKLCCAGVDLAAVIRRPPGRDSAEAGYAEDREFGIG